MRRSLPAWWWTRGDRDAEYASGGVRSGLGVILLVSLASAGLITRGRLAYLYAALASLAVLLEQTFQVWRLDANVQDFVQAGLTAAAFFATAALASTLARYARTSEQIAEERKVDLANLSQINELVIRDMQDGILVIDGQCRISPRTTRARSSSSGRWPSARMAALRDYARRSPASSTRGAPRARRPPTCNSRTPRVAGELQVHFVPIGTGNTPPTVIFIEDAGRMRAQAQQMKLGALDGSPPHTRMRSAIPVVDRARRRPPR